MGRNLQWPPEVKRVGRLDVIRVQIAGKRERYVLGPAGSAESRMEYNRIVTEIETARGLVRAVSPTTVVEVVTSYLDRCRAETHPKQLARVRAAMRPVAARYGHRPASEFGPLALEVVREEWVRNGYCRKLCNQHASLVRAAFKWAASRELVGPEIYQRLATLPPLLSGRTHAPDRPRVLPVADEVVALTLAELPRIPAAMVRLQLLTGMRPAEVCLLRGADVVRPWKEFGGVEVWLYHLDKHKTAWKGGERNVPLGPRAQEILAPYLDGRDADAYCFSPAEATAEHREQLRADRKTPVQPSQVARAREAAARRTVRRREPRGRYDRDSYAQAIARACKRAGVEPWAPNRLRHAAGTRVEAEGGREDARCVLGHSNPQTTSVYAEASERAGQVAARAG